MFEKFNEAQYRALALDELEERRSLIAGLAENPETSDETMAELVEESKRCKAEFERRDAFAQMRGARIAQVAGGIGKTIEKRNEEHEAENDPFDTVEYRNAFMDYFCRGKSMPEQFRGGIYATRGDAHTTTTDTPTMIPTTLSRKIIEELEADNGIWSRVTKTNIKGGVEYPILELKPVATWVGEQQVSDTQKLEAKLKVSFSYYELECRISQTMLESIVTFDEFQRRFVPLAVKAILDKCEEGVIAGSGSGQMLGIVNDARVTNTVEMTAAQVASWKDWRKIVKAAIPRAYRKGSIIMSQAMWDSYIETMSDDANAPVSIGYNAVTGVETLRFMGFDVILVDDELIPNFDDADAGDVFCIYGQLSDYCVNTNQQLQAVQYVDWDTRKKKTVAYMVLDGKVLDPHGFVLVKKKA